MEIKRTNEFDDNTNKIEANDRHEYDQQKTTWKTMTIIRMLKKGCPPYNGFRTKDNYKNHPINDNRDHCMFELIPARTLMSQGSSYNARNEQKSEDNNKTHPQ